MACVASLDDSILGNLVDQQSTKPVALSFAFIDAGDDFLDRLDREGQGPSGGIDWRFDLNGSLVDTRLSSGSQTSAPSRQKSGPDTPRSIPTLGRPPSYARSI